METLEFDIDKNTFLDLVDEGKSFHIKVPIKNMKNIKYSHGNKRLKQDDLENFLEDFPFDKVDEEESDLKNELSDLRRIIKEIAELTETASLY